MPMCAGRVCHSRCIQSLSWRRSSMAFCIPSGGPAAVPKRIGQLGRPPQVSDTRISGRLVTVRRCDPPGRSENDRYDAKRTGRPGREQCRTKAVAGAIPSARGGEHCPGLANRSAGTGSGRSLSVRRMVMGGSLTRHRRACRKATSRLSLAFLQPKNTLVRTCSVIPRNRGESRR